MIFVGDIILPIRNSIQIKSLPCELQHQDRFGSLKDGIVDNSDEKIKNSRGVFNAIDAVKELKDAFNIKGFTLANNHILNLIDLENTMWH